MKRNIFFSLILALAAIVLASCSKDTEGVTRITQYATLELQGDEEVIIKKGETYTDAGCKAEMGGEDATSMIVTDNPVDVNKSGIYTITYKVTNADGFSATASRTVYVYDANDPCEGMFYTTTDSYRSYNGNNVLWRVACSVFIYNNGGAYFSTDLLGGWYEQRAGYGSNYAGKGSFLVEEDGTLSFIGGEVLPGWASDGYKAESLTGKFDYTTGTYTYATVMAGRTFNITLTK